ncbi:MAG: CofH family radical SAM protein [bacterium]|nr:CofH family radical SAM protein [bacterium]
MKKELENKIYSGERLSPEEGEMLFSWNLLELGRAADERRKKIYPNETVGFIVDRIINYTNRCEAGCSFCAFHSRAGTVDRYELTIDEILEKIDELVQGGGTQVMLQGGLDPEYTIDRLVEMVRAIKERFPEIYLHSFSPAEVVYLAKKSGQNFSTVIGILKEAGLNSMPGASDLLVDRVRHEVSPNKLTKDEWRGVIHALHENGMGSTATMTYGMGETMAEKIEHLETVRTVQDETGILRAFIPWSFSPNNTKMDFIVPATGIDYLKTVAVARIYLDNITYIQAGWLTEGLKLAQVALTMGANDMGGVLTEEVVVKATGVQTSTDMNQLIDIIKNSGKTPVLRDSEYNILKSFF